MKMEKQIKNVINRKIKKRIISFAILFLKPFIIPILIILILIYLCCYITDIFYIFSKDESEKEFKEELKYYTYKEYTEEEKQNFFDSVSYFLSGLFNNDTNLIWPVPGYTLISSHFGFREKPTVGASTMHSGIDIPAPEGTEIVSIMNGKITFTDWDGAGGYTIKIKSQDNKDIISYSHVDPNFIVYVGQEVKKGEVIGKVGPKYVSGPESNPYHDSTGKKTNGATTGCHCHLSIKKDGKLIDPEEYLQEALEKERKD